MARCVIRAGFEVTVCDKNPQALAEFVKVASQVTDKPSECTGQEMVIVMVANDDQVKEVIMGSGGLLDALEARRPPLVAIMSTVLPQTIQEIAVSCSQKGVHLIDAPVSGLPVVAEQGKLTIMVGGNPADLEHMLPVLEAMGENIFNTGPLGSAAVTKLVNNIVGVTNLHLSVEPMLVGKEYGLDPHKLAAIMEISSGRNFSPKTGIGAKRLLAIFKRALI